MFNTSYKQFDLSTCVLMDRYYFILANFVALKYQSYLTVFEHTYIELLFAKGHGKIDMPPSFLLCSIRNINVQNVRNWNVAPT